MVHGTQSGAIIISIGRKTSRKNSREFSWGKSISLQFASIDNVDINVDIVDIALAQRDHVAKLEKYKPDYLE
jgi:hypothetical protein